MSRYSVQLKTFTKLSKIHKKIIQKQLQVSRIRKHENKDMYLQKKGQKLLMN